METKNPIQSAERIFHILEFIAMNGPSGVVEIGTALDLHKSTVHRMLLSLISMGYASQDEETGKYELTFKLVRLSSQFLSKIDIYAIAHPYIERLANECQETVHLVQRAGNEVVYIDKVEPVDLRESSIRMASHIGLMRPMYCSGVGKAILAELPAEEVRSIWAQSNPEKKTEHTIMTFKQLEEEIAGIRERGYAMDNEENEIGVRCIAAVILDYHNKAKYAFSISAPVNRMTDDRVAELAEHVLNMKKELSRRLGNAGM
ncbi:MAG TPA: IclR family transcriptional regulator [Lachnospiraceae bacterium]|jgi:DNA-binding IclR family transcriptional regulator|nr:IclR family transcriptional regulator [Lachnospiraceae bacterium]HBY71392.1 IclR family transcriptional regulator [Lachnospiraceae bacterium]HCA69071.1 IclR family transcriptional regulator [Lachnospiraceae bacterium]HCM13050.1 IclR family transcriptional regulator [Lachnospiraceae bacterium]HCR40120.1 IclR family transcriptional regulator [Lachnospiraceae bacterium]